MEELETEKRKNNIVIHGLQASQQQTKKNY